MPCRRALEGFELYGTEPWQTYANNIEYTKVRQITPRHWDIQPAMSRWVEKTALGELLVEEALRGMDEEIDQINGKW